MTDDHTVLGRALALVDVCLAHDRPVSLADLTRDSDLPKATVRRLADDLVRRGLLRREPTGYAAGPMLIAAGTRALEQRTSRGSVTPLLVDLHMRTRASVFVVDVSHDDCWCVLDLIYDRAAQATGFAGDWPQGGREPGILATAAGLMAYASRPADAMPLLRSGLRRLTPYTPVQPRLVEQALDRAAADGEVVEHERVFVGWSCLAVPIPELAAADPSDPRSAGGRGVVRRTSAVLGLVAPRGRFHERHHLAAAHAAAGEIAREWSGVVDLGATRDDVRLVYQRGDTPGRTRRPGPGVPLSGTPPF